METKFDKIGKKNEKLAKIHQGKWINLVHEAKLRFPIHLVCSDLVLSRIG